MIGYKKHNNTSPEDYCYRFDKICKIVRGNSSFKKDELLENGEFVALQYGKTYQVDEVNNSFSFYVNSEFYKKGQVVNFGNTILISTSETLEDLGHSCFYNRNDVGLIGGEQILLKPIKNVLSEKYLYYYSKYFCKELRKYATGLKVFRFNTDDLKNVFISVPPLTEQTQIATYLDTKTQAIDKKIKLLTTKIEYYKELRKTIINNAVTKGLDKKVKLKESELGLVPQHWAIKRLKEIDRVIMGQSPKSDDYNFEGKGYPFLQGNAEFGNLFPTPTTWCEFAVKVININDIMLSVRAPIGAVNIANQKYGIGRGLCAIRAKKSYSKYLYYYFISKNHILQSLGTGTTYIAISLNDVSNLLVAFPPKTEQTEIANYLDTKTTTIDAIINNLQLTINTYKELRKTLINDVVTGKVKVIADDRN